MKKKGVIYLLGIVTGTIIIGSISLVLAAVYSASEIMYTPTDNTWNVSNVQSAIDYLKENSITLNFGSSHSEQSIGSRSAIRSTSIELLKGKYIVEVSSVATGGSAANSSSDYTTSADITCNSNNCIITNISGRSNTGSGGSTAAYVTTGVVYVEISEETDILNYTGYSGNNGNHGQVVSISATPIN